jgi:Raf kinase inhibitor-like YbhB/YbcL family protein
MLAVATALAACGGSHQPSAQSTGGARPTSVTHEKSAMQLTSAAFANGSTIPAEYTCEGAGRSPPLAWSGAPANAQGFAIIVEDPDAPNGTFRHWGLYDIPANTHELAAGAAQNGGLKQTKNDFGSDGYGPPCPPRGDRPHHYHFRLLALDAGQLAGSPANVKDLLEATEGHVVGKAELIGLYGRQ